MIGLGSLWSSARPYRKVTSRTSRLLLLDLALTHGMSLSVGANVYRTGFAREGLRGDGVWDRDPECVVLGAKGRVTMGEMTHDV